MVIGSYSEVVDVEEDLAKDAGVVEPLVGTASNASFSFIASGLGNL